MSNLSKKMEEKIVVNVKEIESAFGTPTLCAECGSISKYQLCEFCTTIRMTVLFKGMKYVQIK